MKVLHVFTILSTAESFFDGQFKFLTENGQDIWVVSSSNEDDNFTNRNKITYRQINITRRISPFADIKTIRELVSLIRREKFDAVVGHTPKGAMVAMFAARLAGVRIRVYYRHGLIYTTATGFKRLILKTVERLTAACASRVVNVSNSLSDLAVRDHLNSDRKQTVIGAGTCGGIDAVGVFNPSLVDCESINALRDKLGIATDDFVAGFCGRICKEKGIRELIDGFKIFHKDNPKSKLLLVGGYDARDILPDEYKSQIDENPAIITTGRIDKSDLPAYYSLMDVFMFPSYREGFGMCVIEAAAMGVPALVSRSHGCVDSIREHITGEYIDISPEGIARGLAQMTASDNLRAYSSECRDHVLKNYDFSVMWPLILDLYSRNFQ